MTNEKPQRRVPWLLIGARWCSIVLYALLALVVVWLAEDAIDGVAGPLTDQLAGVRWWLVGSLYVAALAASVAAAVVAGRATAFSVVTLLRYPPPLAAALVAAVVFLFVPLADPLGTLQVYAVGLTRHSPITLVGIAGAAVVFAVTVRVANVISARRQVADRPVIVQEAVTSGREDLADLLTWASSDEPISDPAQDRYGHDALARVIADRIASGSEENTAVLGPPGSGKTTVMRLVGYHLGGSPDILFVPVTLWPFDSVEAAASGVLHALTRALGERVSVHAIAGVPGEYAAVVEGAGGWWGSLVRAARTGRGPGEMIDALSDVAVTAGLRLVLWVEDFERFSGGGGGGGTSGERADLGPLRALLHALDGRDGIVVIMAGASLDARFDLEKIARHIERVPAFRGDRGWAELERYRRRALGGHPRPIVDLVSEAARNNLAYDVLSRVESQQSPGTRVADSGEVYRCVLSLIQTPRMLKSLIRLTDSQWQVLAGEIDFDAVVAANALRLRCPTLFSVVEAQVDAVRRGLENASAATGTPNHLLQKAAAELDTNLLVSAQNLLRFVFPKYPMDMTTCEVPTLHLPQGFSDAEPTDYWLRYLTAQTVPEDQSDQRLLGRIEEWAQTPGMRLLDPWQGSRPIEVLTALRPQLLKEHFPRFLADWCHETARHNDRPASHKWFLERLDGFRECLESPSPALRETVVQIVSAHSSEDLGLAAEISWWSGTINGTLSAAAKTALCDSLVAMCREKDAAQRLISALHSDRLGLLGVAIDPLLVPTTSAGAEWTRVRSMLLAAARTNPDRVFASLTRAVVWDREVSRFRPALNFYNSASISDRRFEFIPERLQDLFGDQLNEWIKLVKTWEPNGSLDTQLLGMGRFWVRSA